MALAFTSVVQGLPAPHTFTSARHRIGSVAELHLDGTPVGTVTVTGGDASWGFARFRPGPGFSAFATTFGLWAMLMHADGDDHPLSRAASAELSRAENALDRIKARLFFPDDGVAVDLFQLNIDGKLLEWKEY